MSRPLSIQVSSTGRTRESRTRESRAALDRAGVGPTPQRSRIRERERREGCKEQKSRLHRGRGRERGKEGKRERGQESKRAKSGVSIARERSVIDRATTGDRQGPHCCKSFLFPTHTVIRFGRAERAVRSHGRIVRPAGAPR